MMWYLVFITNTQKEETERLDVEEEKVAQARKVPKGVVSGRTFYSDPGKNGRGEEFQAPTLTWGRIKNEPMLEDIWLEKKRR